MNSIRKSILTKCLFASRFPKHFSTQAQSEIPFYDVAIAGAGPTGTALACALAHHPYFKENGKKIALIDQAPAQPLSDFSTKDPIPDQRVVSLTHTSIRLLQAMGAWDLINKDRLGEMRQMQVWEIGGKSHVKFNDNPNSEILGYVIENKHLLSALHERIKQLDNCDVIIPDKITDFSVPENSWAKIHLEKRGEIHARLAVGSEGANSVLKNKAKISSWGWSSNQFGIVCTVKTSVPNTCAWQRFMSSGPIALLPLYDNYSSIVWSCEPTWYDKLMKMSNEEFIDELNTQLSRSSFVDTPNFLFGGANFEHPPVVQEICNKRLSFPLRFQHANKYVDNRLALIGDAAHAIHPLAGQGLNLGLADVSMLANNISKNLNAGNDIGSEDNLTSYEYESKRMNYAFTLILEGLKRSYEANTSDPWIFLRNAASNIMNNMSPVKQLIVKFADGDFFQSSNYEWKKN